MAYRSELIDDTSGFTWKDAFISLGIAAITAASLAVGATYYFGMQLGNITTGFKLFFG